MKITNGSHRYHINKHTILVIIFWHFLIIQHRSEQPQVKRYLISSITSLVDELPHELLNELGLRILGNYEILEKCQIWVKTQPSAKSSFQKLNSDNIAAKKRVKLDNKFLRCCPILLDLFTFCQIFCSGLQIFVFL